MPPVRGPGISLRVAIVPAGLADCLVLGAFATSSIDVNRILVAQRRAPSPPSRPALGVRLQTADGRTFSKNPRAGGYLAYISKERARCLRNCRKPLAMRS